MCDLDRHAVAEHARLASAMAEQFRIVLNVEEAGHGRALRYAHAWEALGDFDHFTGAAHFAPYVPDDCPPDADDPHAAPDDLDVDVYREGAAQRHQDEVDAHGEGDAS